MHTKYTCWPARRERLMLPFVFRAPQALHAGSAHAATSPLCQTILSEILCRMCAVYAYIPCTLQHICTMLVCVNLYINASSINAAMCSTAAVARRWFHARRAEKGGPGNVTFNDAMHAATWRWCWRWLEAAARRISVRLPTRWCVCVCGGCVFHFQRAGARAHWPSRRALVRRLLWLAYTFGAYIGRRPRASHIHRSYTHAAHARVPMPMYWALCVWVSGTCSRIIGRKQLKWASDGSRAQLFLVFVRRTAFTFPSSFIGERVDCFLFYFFCFDKCTENYDIAIRFYYIFFYLDTLISTDFTSHDTAPVNAMNA